MIPKTITIFQACERLKSKGDFLHDIRIAVSNGKIELADINNKDYKMGIIPTAVGTRTYFDGDPPPINQPKPSNVKLAPSSLLKYIIGDTVIYTESLNKYFQESCGFAVYDDTENESKPTPARDDISESERESVLKLILGMAIDAYGYKPFAERNTATGTNNGSIHAALSKQGLTINDPKTIRKYLQEAEALFLTPPSKP